MKNILYTLLILTAVSLTSSCKKSDPFDPTNPNAALCVRYNWGVLGIDNQNRDDYKVYIRGGYQGTVTAYGFLKLLVPPGPYDVAFIQTGPFIKKPKTDTVSVNVERCYTTNLPFSLP